MEIALRDGGIRAVLGGSIRQIGETFSIAVRIMNPQDGSTVVSSVEVAKDIDGILDAIHRLARKVRQKLGESLSDIEDVESQIPIEWYEKVTTSHFKALSLYRRCFTHVNQFNWEKALLLVKQAIEEDPSFAMAYAIAGFMNNNLGREAEAKMHFERAMPLTENLTDRERYFILGGDALISGNHEKAIDQYSVLVELYPDDYWGHINLFDAYGLIGNNKKAYQHLKEAARIRPNDPGTLSLLLLYEIVVSENLETGEKYYEQILQIAPNFDFPSFQFYKLFKLWIKEDLEGAQREIQEALSRTQGYSTWTRYGLNMCFVNFEISQGKFQKAIEWIKKTAAIYREKKIKSIEGDALLQLGLIFREQGKNKEFKNQMHFLLKNFPDSVASGAAGWLAYQEAQDNNKKEAIQFLEQLERGKIYEREKQAFIRLIKGVLAKKEDKFEEAIDHFKEARQLFNHLMHPPPHPYHPMLPNLELVEVYELNNQLDSAIEVCQEIITHKLRAFLPSFTKGPTAWVKAHYHLGRLYHKKGNIKSAIQHYQKFLSLWKDADPGIAEVEDAKKRLALLNSLQ